MADFGLAEDVYTTGYFRENDGGVKLPFKWMAPESLTDGVFTEKTDVVRLYTGNNDKCNATLASMDEGMAGLFLTLWLYIALVIPFFSIIENC